jgi:hypothetical protein
MKKIFLSLIVIAILMITPVSANWFEGACQETSTIISSGTTLPNVYLGVLNETTYISGYAGAPGDYFYKCNGTNKVAPQIQVSPGAYTLLGQLLVNDEGKWGISSTAAYYGQRYWFNYRNYTANPPPPPDVYLNVKDIYTRANISGVTAGIQNQSSGIWRYETPAGIPYFNRTDVSPQYSLSIGQTVVFSAFKEGIYIANHTEYTIPSSTSTAVLYLTPLAGPPNTTAFNITVSPQSVPVSGTVTGTVIYPTDPPINAIRWYAYYPGDTYPSDFYDSTSTASSQKHLNYAKNGSTWYGWDTAMGAYTNNKGTTMPNPVSLYPRYSGQVLVGCYIYCVDGTWHNPTTTIYVGEGQGLQNITFHAEAALTGMHISPAYFSIQNIGTGAWSNGSEIRAGQRDVQYPAGTVLHAEASVAGSGYSTGVLNYQVQDYQGARQNGVIQMWTNTSTNLSQTTANLVVMKNVDFTPIQGANLVLSNGQSCYTSSSGACQFTLNNGTTTYTSTVTATGYQTNQFVFLPVGASYSKAFMLVAIGATPTPYITVPPGGTPTGNSTGIPTLDPTARKQKVDNAADIWYNNLYFLSMLLFIATVYTIMQKSGFMGGGKGKKKS